MDQPQTINKNAKENKNSAPILLQGPSGTRDFYPKDMLKRNWLFDQWTNISKKFGFQQYDGPILEHSNLYTRKGGDDILKEMYSFKDADGIEVCLRPEMTPTVARMAILELPKTVLPLKWFSIPQCWRFESTTRGRKREHFQWNVDIFGAEMIKSEIEILSMIVSFFKQIGLTDADITIKISNRMILQKMLTKMGIDPDKFEKAYNIIDKIKKVSHDELSNMLQSEIGINQESIDTIVKLTKVTNILDLALFLDKDDNTVYEMVKIFELAKLSGIDTWLQFDASIVRGLSYYTGVVFEGFFKNSTLQRSICGGGRYDNLFQKYGYAKKVPAVGFGFGDIVTLEVLAELGKLPQFDSSVDYCIIAYTEDLYPNAVNIANRLRDKNKTVVQYMKCNRKLKAAFSYADRIGAKYAILVAPDEYKENKIVVKNLRLSEDNMNTFDIDQYINQYVNQQN
ncbi:MAG: histidine--tRNA ligase [Nitrosopumilus sp.]|nr:histidine--tRNA ligase [Nitrosopumilus sp.]